MVPEGILITDAALAATTSPELETVLVLNPLEAVVVPVVLVCSVVELATQG